ncbi:helix-turn-helix domain-containing protein [Actinoplanes sp. NPDC051470]|uniref:helix-turn-helix transcriptional regulator n=1 Tax=Actinoplanes sp. NPDC051470 TaxID=3157224 RepID=UPI0034393709
MWETVGIPEVEARVYEALIPPGQATVAALAARTQLGPGRVTSALAGLVGRGLVTRTPGRPVRYVAVAPSLAGSVLIAKREHELGRLQQHLHRLDEAFQAGQAARQRVRNVEVIEGASKIYRAFVRIQRAARLEVRSFDKPPYFVPPGEHGDEGPNLEERQHLAAGQVGYRVVYDAESVALPGRMDNILEGIRKGERARTAAGLPVKLVIADATSAIISSAGDHQKEISYVLHESSLLDLTIGLFEATWERATPITRAEPRPHASSGPLEHRLMSLLASGATDAVIARTLGWSVRTVQRHAHELMEQLGARTRFQMGMEAVRRGWL